MDVSIDGMRADGFGADFAGRGGAVLVSGGTGGLGQAICELFADRGSDVAFTWNSNSAGAAQLAQRLVDRGVAAHHRSVDLADPAAARQTVESLIAESGGVHTVVHAAGPLVRQVHLSRVEPERMNEVLIAESGAFFAVVQPALAALREVAGSVVAVTSAATARHARRDGLSSVPKASVEAMVRGIAVEEGRYGVRANSVGPGMLEDGMARQLQADGDLDAEALEAARRLTPLRRFGSAGDIAEAVCFLASERASFISGQHLRVDGGYSA